MNTTPESTSPLVLESTPSTAPSAPSTAAPAPAWGTPVEPPAPMGSEPPSYSGAEPAAPVPPRPSGAAGQVSQVPPMAGTFDAIRRFGLTRASDRRIGGVAAGVAHRAGVSPLAVRVGFVVLALFGGFGALLYALLWMLLPEPDGRIHLQELLIGKASAGFVGALILMLVASPNSPVFWIALVAGVVAVMVMRRRRTNAVAH